MSVTHKSTKGPFPIFFIDIEPSLNYTDIFKMSLLCFTKIKVKTPHSKKDILQCRRCQAYNHTRSYCKHSYRCVRCGEEHESTSCTKNRCSSAKLALCRRNHPVKFEGYQSHIDLKNKLFVLKL